MKNFIRNAWYAACWSGELTTKPIAKLVLGEKVALFRSSAGLPAAVEDCCPHRFAPLSLGSVEGERIVCGYHGMQFGSDGACVAIPGQKGVPKRINVRAYPVAEKFGLTWLWMGRPDKADEGLVPDVHWISDKDWHSVTGTVRYECNWLLLVDNLIDLSHTTFVHKSTIGTDDVADTPVTTERTGNVVTVTREMTNTDPSNFYRRLGGFDVKIDRWQRIWLDPPSTVVIDAGALPAGTADKSKGIDTRVISVLKPVDENTVDQLWAFSRDFSLDNQKLDRDIEKAIVHTFQEDAGFLAGQQKNMEARTDQKMLNNASDAGVVLARRVIDECLAADAADRH